MEKLDGLIFLARYER